MTPITRSNSGAALSEVAEIRDQRQSSSGYVSMLSDLECLFDEVQEVENDIDDENIDGKFDADIEEDDDHGPDFNSEEARQKFLRTSIDASVIYQNQRKVLITNILSMFREMSSEAMVEVLSGRDESKLKLLTCMHYVLAYQGESDDVNFARQLIADFAKTQTRPIVAEMFGKGPVNLAGIDLSGIHFVGVDLSQANFDGANLSGASFEKSNLHLATFAKSNLTGAKFISTDLGLVKFVESNLTRASFKHVEFSGVEFIDAVLREADFSGEKLNQVQITKSNLCLANFRGAELGMLNLSNMNLRGADFRDVQIGHNNLMRCDLSGANFSGSSLRHLTLLGSNLYLANLSDTGLGRGKLNGAIWKESDLSDLRIVTGTLFGNGANESAVKRSLSMTAAAPKSVQTNDSMTVTTTSKSLSVSMPQTVPQTMRPSPVEISQVSPAKAQSVWGWFSGIAFKIGGFFRSVYLSVRRFI